MERKRILWGMSVLALALGMAFVGCTTGNGDAGDNVLGTWNDAGGNKLEITFPDAWVVTDTAGKKVMDGTFTSNASRSMHFLTGKTIEDKPKAWNGTAVQDGDKLTV
ncbi:MAG: hypothetical protein FWD94_08440, partial [Treponema sp.]|nr:hypothetical protein [Treponema sp.]